MRLDPFIGQYFFSSLFIYKETYDLSYRDVFWKKALLGQIGDPLSPEIWGLDNVAVYADATVFRGQGPEDQFQQRRLTGAISSQYPYNLATLASQVYIRQYFPPPYRGDDAVCFQYVSVHRIMLLTIMIKEANSPFKNQE